MKPRPLSLTEASFLLFAIVVIVHGVFFPWKGFYMDDWRFIQLWESAPNHSLRALMTAFNVDNFCFYRPLDIPYYSIQYWLFGRAAWAYQLLQLVFDVSAVLLLHAAWRRATDQAALPFIAAVIFAVYPNHSSTHHWLSAPHAAVTALFSAALLLQLRAAQERRLALTFVASALFVAAILIYEAVLPLAVLFPALCALRLRLDGSNPLKGRVDAVRSCIPLALSAFAALIYQQVLIPRLFPRGQTRPMSFELIRFLKVLGRSFECTTSGILALISDSIRHAVTTRLWMLFPAVVLALAAGVWLWRRADIDECGELFEPEWWVGGVAAWIACYAPVALSAQRYVPHVFDEQNRLNAAGTVGAAMLAASCLMGLSKLRPRIAAIVFPMFFALSCGVDWISGIGYMRSWQLQTRVLTGIMSVLSAGPAEIVLSGVPETVGHAAVFHADWEFDCALQVWTKRSDLSGRLERGAHGLSRQTFLYKFPEERLEELDR